MDFLRILKSLDELLFELMSWLAFYPLTMARILARPLGMMGYSDTQIEHAEDGRYDDSLSPPLLLMITLVITNAIAMAAHVPRPEATGVLENAIYNSPQNLLLFRCLVFALIPLVAATTLVRRRGDLLSRTTLHAPFYAQCFLAAPWAMVIGLALVASQRNALYSAFISPAVALVATAWFLWVQSRWFARELSIPVGRGVAIALWAFVRALMYLAVLMAMVAYI
ncbi:hypothetical protein [Phenylobacterium sp.]|uniref:hypothetical protein n=1 Tax=Phenylobacterium sp. TaxID=1871053 RepID=UPI00286A821B|nr:hypothetical protein [Phenylobacterium sp.]